MLQKNRIVNIKYFVRKMLLDSIFDLGKCPNRKTHESESAFFWLGHFARSKIKSESIFLIKYYIINSKKKRAFWPLFNKVKNGFPLVFSNLARKGSMGFFQARKLIFLPNCLYLPTKQPWGSPKFGFCHQHL